MYTSLTLAILGKTFARRRARIAGQWDLPRDRRCSVSLMIAILAIPLSGMVGLAIDYGLRSELQTTLDIAANAAALNAAKAAASGYAIQDPNYQAEGVTAGKQWFAVETGTTINEMKASNITANVSVSQTSLLLTASVSYSASMKSIFGRLFNTNSYTVNGTVAASWNLAPFLEVVMLLDNSGSMDIGATPADILTLQTNSPCDTSNEFSSANNYQNLSTYEYYLYQCSYNGGGTYDGPLACPFTANGTTFTTEPFPYYNAEPAYSTSVQCPAVNGQPAYAGPPCAFACHFDGTKKAGLGNDLWAMARRLGVTTRFDLVKNATNEVLNMMKTYTSSTANISVGIYTFNTALTQIYPSSGEAGTIFTAANTAVGSPPVPGSGVYTDTGIQPEVSSPGLGTNNNSNYEEAMNGLATTYVTPAGDGSTPAKAQKVLFLITDGMDDESNGTFQPMSYTYCQQYKNMGYSVYVVYTPYYPLEFWKYLETIMPWVEGTGTDTIAYNLQQCSSATSAANLGTYYIEATDSTTLNAALKAFLKSAIISLPGRYTQ
jgi:Flp pilus assembly protein TadG